MFLEQGDRVRSMRKQKISSLLDESIKNGYYNDGRINRKLIASQ